MQLSCVFKKKKCQTVLMWLEHKQVIPIVSLKKEWKLKLQFFSWKDHSAPSLMSLCTSPSPFSLSTFTWPTSLHFPVMWPTPALACWVAQGCYHQSSLSYNTISALAAHIAEHIDEASSSSNHPWLVEAAILQGILLANGPHNVKK